ncbi:MAG: methyltransferase [Acidocella sp. 20-57-95]|nr:MAG: methyltransferase [Acidocella sp. 20-57-95]OYV59567.1 MAG: methyltransferase [Acidocella sp. 21-58-7]
MQPEAYTLMAETEGQHWWFRGRRAIVDATIRQLALPQHARILELGCGTGGNLAMLSHYGEVTAIEMDETARNLAQAKAGPGCRILAGALPDQLPLTNEVFDLICLFDVLEHVNEDFASLQAIEKFLAPGGALVLTVPAYEKLWSAHDVMLHHRRRYEKADLQRKLQNTGLVISKLSFANMFLFPVALAARLADQLLRRTSPTGDKIPPLWLNETMARIFASERHLLRIMNLPFGLSLLAVVRKPGIA